MTFLKLILGNLVLACTISSVNAATLTNVGETGPTSGVGFLGSNVGSSDGSAYGQVFSVEGNLVLEDWSFYLDDQLGRSVSLKYYLYEWDYSTESATGSSLFESGIYSTTNNDGLDGWEVVNFGSIDVELNSEKYYISIMKPTEDNQNSASMGYVHGGAYEARTLYNLPAEKSFTESEWDSTTGELAYTANFSSVVSSVPEPSSYALMIAGMGLVGFMTARSRKKL